MSWWPGKESKQGKGGLMVLLSTVIPWGMKACLLQADPRHETKPGQSQCSASRPLSSRQPAHEGSCGRPSPITPQMQPQEQGRGQGRGPLGGRNLLQSLMILLVTLLLTDFLLQGRQLGVFVAG